MQTFDDRPQYATAAGAPVLQRVERLAKLLDEAFTVPGTRIKVGLDPLIGLLPVVGDAIGLALGTWFIYEAHRLGAPTALKWKMARNVLFDAMAGLVPVVGDLMDVLYRSNHQNLRLLRGHFAPVESARVRRGRGLALVLGLAASAVAAGYWYYRH